MYVCVYIQDIVRMCYCDMICFQDMFSICQPWLLMNLGFVYKYLHQ